MNIIMEKWSSVTCNNKIYTTEMSQKIIRDKQGAHRHSGLFYRYKIELKEETLDILYKIIPDGLVKYFDL